VEEDEVQEQAEQQDLARSEPTERVKWEVNYYWVDGVGVPMADHLIAWRVAAILQEYVPFHGVNVTPAFPKKTKCILYACQDQVSCI
jgi:hypothetical protein